MIACPNCNTFNPDSEHACLGCGANLRAADESSRGSNRCANGHPIDPSWSSCPYCTHGGVEKRTVVEGSGVDDLPLQQATRLEGAAPLPMRAQAKTRLESPAQDSGPSMPPPLFPPSTARPLPTRLEAPAASAATARNRTVLQSAEPEISSGTEAPSAPQPGQPIAAAAPSARPVAPSAPQPRLDTRPMVGVLVAPDSVPGGLMFALRTGKNLIGGDPGSDICLSHDPNVSAQHALILFRGGCFYLNDQMSTNGTVLNGQELAATTQAVLLTHRDHIRCGKTDLILLTIDQSTGD